MYGEEVGGGGKWRWMIMFLRPSKHGAGFTHAWVGFPHAGAGFPRVWAQLLKLQRPRAEMFSWRWRRYAERGRRTAVIGVINVGDISDTDREGKA